jgi:phosphoglycerate dehydrogenase-like enzyme
VDRLHVLEFIRSTDGVWNLPSSQIERMRARFPGVEFLSPLDRREADRLLPDADVVFGWAVTPDNFGSASRLQWIHVSAAGLGSLLFPDLVESEVVVTNGRGLHAVAMAEHTIGVLLAFARKLHLARDAQHAHRWDQDRLFREDPDFVELGRTTLGVIGMGSIGGEIAKRARALGMRVLAVRRHPSNDPAPAHEQFGPAGTARVLAESDWIVLATPLTSETRGLIGARELAIVKPGAVLVNLGRGALVDEHALIDALAAGRLGGAALDVFEHEPLPADSPLWDLPNVILTPHISGLSARYWERAIDLFARNLEHWVEGRPLVNLVDKRRGY